MRRATLFLLFPLLVVLATTVMASSRVNAVLNEGLERIAAVVEEQLIAPCCWRAPLSKHYSGTAERMKEDLRKMLVDGKTGEEIVDYYKGIYGERILSSPPNAGFNRMAYLFTPLMFLVGAGIIFFTLRRWRSGRLNSGNAAMTEDADSPSKDPRHQSRIDDELNAYD